MLRRSYCLRLLSAPRLATEGAPHALACADSEPFTFTAALQTHFAVHNLATHARHVRVLGLGGKWIFDYAPDPMHPRLDMEREDYVTFGGEGVSPGVRDGRLCSRIARSLSNGFHLRLVWSTACHLPSLRAGLSLRDVQSRHEHALAEEVVDRLYVGAKGGDVFLCPGDRSYHEVILREGLRDVGAYNPHDRQPASAPHFVSMPAGRVARPVTYVAIALCCLAKDELSWTPERCRSMLRHDGLAA